MVQKWIIKTLMQAKAKKAQTQDIVKQQTRNLKWILIFSISLIYLPSFSDYAIYASQDRWYHLLKEKKLHVWNQRCHGVWCTYEFFIQCRNLWVRDEWIYRQWCVSLCVLNYAFKVTIQAPDKPFPSGFRRTDKKHSLSFGDHCYTGSSLYITT